MKPFLVRADSPETSKGLKWLKEHTEAPLSTIWIDETEGGKARDALSKEEIEDLKPYRLEKTESLYRGLTWSDEEDYQGDMVHILELENQDDVPLPKIGDTFEGTTWRKVISWTKDLELAKKFAKNRKFGIVVEAKVKPEQTLVDTTRLPKEVCEGLLKIGCKEQEVITLDFPIYGKIIWIQKDKKSV